MDEKEEVAIRPALRLPHDLLAPTAVSSRMCLEVHKSLAVAILVQKFRGVCSLLLEAILDAKADLLLRQSCRKSRAKFVGCTCFSIIRRSRNGLKPGLQAAINHRKPSVAFDLILVVNEPRSVVTQSLIPISNSPNISENARANALQIVLAHEDFPAPIPTTSWPLFPTHLGLTFVRISSLLPPSFPLPSRE